MRLWPAETETLGLRALTASSADPAAVPSHRAGDCFSMGILNMQAFASVDPTANGGLPMSKISSRNACALQVSCSMWQLQDRILLELNSKIVPCCPPPVLPMFALHKCSFVPEPSPLGTERWASPSRWVVPGMQVHAQQRDLCAWRQLSVPACGPTAIRSASQGLGSCQVRSLCTCDHKSEISSRSE